MEEPGPHRRQREPVQQEGSECSQLPPTGYLIDSSNHPRWVDTLKSNQSLREPAARDCCYSNSNLARPEVHLGPQSCTVGLGTPGARCRGCQLPHPQLEGSYWSGGDGEVRVQPGLGFMTPHTGCGTSWEGGRVEEKWRRVEDYMH